MHLLVIVRYNTPKYRFVVRFSRKAIVCQIVYATVAGDVTVAAAYSQARPGAPPWEARACRPQTRQLAGIDLGVTELRPALGTALHTTRCKEAGMLVALRPGPGLV